jgi:hypothetical protein
MQYKNGMAQLSQGTGQRPRSKRDELILMGMGGGGGGTQYAYDDPMTSPQPMMDGPMPQQPNSGLLQALQELMVRMGVSGSAQAAPEQMPPAPTPELQEAPMDEFGGASRGRFSGYDTDENLPPEYAQDDKRAQTEAEINDVQDQMDPNSYESMKKLQDSLGDDPGAYLKRLKQARESGAIGQAEYDELADEFGLTEEAKEE